VCYSWVKILNADLDVSIDKMQEWAEMCEEAADVRTRDVYLQYYTSISTILQ
jgi:hypothetical protein